MSWNYIHWVPSINPEEHSHYNTSQYGIFRGNCVLFISELFWQITPCVCSMADWFWGKREIEKVRGRDRRKVRVHACMVTSMYTCAQTPTHTHTHTRIRCISRGKVTNRIANATVTVQTRIRSSWVHNTNVKHVQTCLWIVLYEHGRGCVNSSPTWTEISRLSDKVGIKRPP